MHSNNNLPSYTPPIIIMRTSDRGHSPPLKEGRGRHGVLPATIMRRYVAIVPMPLLLAIPTATTLATLRI